MVIMGRALFVMAMLAVAPAAQANQCPPPGASPLPVPLPVKLETSIPEPTYRNTQTRTQLAGQNPKGGSAHHAGLTQTGTHFSVKPTMRFFRLPDGRMCAQLTQVEATWRVTQLLVDVATEYRPGTCPYREVWEHENQHVAISQRYFAEAERALRTRLAQLAEQIRPQIVSGNPDATAREVVNRLMAGVQPVLEHYGKETQRANAIIDTPDNYRRVSARCADW